MAEHEQVTLATLRGGAAVEMFDAELQRVLENVLDPKWTPSASLKMTITNPALVGKFSEGQEFYVDFTAVP